MDGDHLDDPSTERIHLAQDLDRRHVLVNAVMNLHAP
jgi:hypothetical protein